jgi:hypothetical protein
MGHHRFAIRTPTGPEKVNIHTIMIPGQRYLIVVNVSQREWGRCNILRVTLLYK